MSDADLVTDRTRVRRKAERGRYDFATVAGILDAGLVAHVGFNGPHGVGVLPMAYARVDDHVYLHGATGNAMLRGLATGADVCVTVTIVDGLVLSRTAFHHSMNYRCAVVVGRAISVDDDAEKATALRAIVEHALAGRSDDCRGPNASELRSTRVIKVAIDEASAKVRTGPPIDDEEDLPLPYWAGEIPLVTTLGLPLADEYVPAGIATPTYDR